MIKNFSTNEILSAVTDLLENKNSPLVLNEEVKNKKKSKNDIPKETEQIILDAEKYKKK